MTDELRKYLNASCTGPLCVQIKDYDKVLEELKTYVARPHIKLWLGTEYTNYAVYEIIKPMVRTEYCSFVFCAVLCEWGFNALAERMDTTFPIQDQCQEPIGRIQRDETRKVNRQIYF